MSIALGDPLPSLEMPATGGQAIKLADLIGSIVVLYFYPKDNTPGCTQESRDFSSLHDAFSAAGATILGVSRDSLRKHENFKSKYEFPFELLADEDEALCQAFEVIKEKKLYGRAYLGVDRSSFVFGRDGRLAREWRGVKVKGHAEEVLEFVETL